MADNTILQGEDKALAITISNSAGVLQSIDDMVDVILYVYRRIDSAVMMKFRKVATTGYTTLLRVSATEYTAIIPKSILAAQPVNELMAECEIQETDARFENSIRRTKGKGKIAFVESSLITE